MSRQQFRFHVREETDADRRFRNEIRAFLNEQAAAGGYLPGGLGGSQRFDPAFSRAMGARGWVGMTWPKRYGGGERTALDRHILAEEMLAAGAPVRAHWVADRQSGPLLLAYGTEEQRTTFLPRMARGECFFCIGMSEADSGSDLASIRTRATKVDGGWLVDGAKLWTSNAHRVHMMILFARTATVENDRHAGVSQFLVDLSWPGVTVRPIINLPGEHDFNEVAFEQVFVPDGMVIGAVGNGWKQVTSELSFERSSPDRYLSTYEVVKQLVDTLGPDLDAREAQALGRLVAHLWTLQKMSMSVAGMLQAGQDPNVEASLVKDLGTQFEQEVPEIARLLVPLARRLGLNGAAHDFSGALDRAISWAPAFSIRGGAREILRGIIARGLGLR